MAASNSHAQGWCCGIRGKGIMLEGSCLCGAVRFVIDAPLGTIPLCPCSHCRKASGSAHSASANVPAAAFRILDGVDELRAYSSSPGKQRVFCVHCGSPVLARFDKYPDIVRIRVGLLDSEIIDRPAAHIFADSRAQWDDICDPLPRYDGREPGGW